MLPAVLALLQTGGAELPGGYAAAILQTLLALGAVCILAWVVLRWGARRGFGLGASRGRIRVIERVSLDPKRSLYLVRVGERVLLLGGGDGASPSVLAELEPGELPEESAPDRVPFSEVWKRLGDKGAEKEGER